MLTPLRMQMLLLLVRLIRRQSFGACGHFKMSEKSNSEIHKKFLSYVRAYMDKTHISPSIPSGV